MFSPAPHCAFSTAGENRRPVRSILALILFAALPPVALALDEATPALRERIALRVAGDRLTKVPDAVVCAYHRLRPFPELTAIGNAR